MAATTRRSMKVLAPRMTSGGSLGARVVLSDVSRRAAAQGRQLVYIFQLSENGCQLSAPLAGGSARGSCEPTAQWVLTLQLLSGGRVRPNQVPPHEIFCDA